MRPKQNPAIVVIKAFGGIRPLARALDLDPGTPFGWRDRGTIPRWHHDEILRIAKRRGYALTREQLGPRFTTRRNGAKPTRTP